MSFFVDVNINNPTQQPNVVDTVAVGQWVQDFLLTRKGERLFNLDYGLDLDDSLFDLIDPQNALILFSQVTTQLEQNLPLVTVLTSASSITPNYQSNEYDINVCYQIAGITNNSNGQPTIFSTKVTLGASDV